MRFTTLVVMAASVLRAWASPAEHAAELTAPDTNLTDVALNIEFSTFVTTEEAFNEMYGVNETTLQKRDSCGGQGDLFNVYDAINMANWLKNTNPNNYHFVNSNWNGIQWALGTARICIFNPWVYGTTWVREWEVGWVTEYIYNICCNPAGNWQW